MGPRPLRWLSLAAAALPFLALGLAQWDYVPIFDAREYTNCLMRVASPESVSFEDLSCALHSNHLWAFVSSFPLRFVPHSYPALLCMQLALGVAALAAFRSLVELCVPGAPREAVALTALLGIAPTFAVGAVDLNPDFMICAVLLWVLVALAQRQFVRAAALGLMLTFCKETGFLLLTLACVAHVIVFVLWPRAAWSERWRMLLRYAPLFVSPLAFLLWMQTRTKTSPNEFVFNHTLSDLLRAFLTPRLGDGPPTAQLATLFVLQFGWVLVLLALPRWVQRLAALVRRGPPTDPPVHALLDLVLILGAWSLTRVKTGAIARYMVPLLPLLLLQAYLSLRAFAPRVRAVALMSVAALF
ncbi:MAG: hypothetical protein JST92_17010, partial [Deltaproteobacteria bacterium]|nr:hypothetical protein [Deltaproteobacteria bacterium]